MLKAGVGILVFSLEIGDYLRVFTFVEPIVVVDTGMAMHRHRVRTDVGLWGCRYSVHGCRYSVHGSVYQNVKVMPNVGRIGSWRDTSLVTKLT